MLHFVMSYMKQNKSCKQTLESVQYELEISFKDLSFPQSAQVKQNVCLLNALPSGWTI